MPCHTWLVLSQVCRRPPVCKAWRPHLDSPGVPQASQPGFTQVTGGSVFPKHLATSSPLQSNTNKCCQSGWRAGSKADTLPEAAVCPPLKASVFHGPHLPGQMPPFLSHKELSEDALTSLSSEIFGTPAGAAPASESPRTSP